MILRGDCLDVLKTLPDNSVDSVVTDPPYGLGKQQNLKDVMTSWIDKDYHEIEGKGFMGKEWDAFVPQPIVWKEVLRVLKPGGHMLVACGTRTQHMMGFSIEYAGFEPRDVISWLYMSGFPKSHNIGKAIDEKLGNKREVVGEKEVKDFSLHEGSMMSKETTEDGKTKTITVDDTKGTTEYEGLGTALKPAVEFWGLWRKPLSESSIADNVLKHGTGGINIDGCRIPNSGEDYYDLEKRKESKGQGVDTPINFTGRDQDSKHGVIDNGRFPNNVLHDGSDEVLNSLPELGRRFFYCAKPSRNERDAGLESFEDQEKVGEYCLSYHEGEKRIDNAEAVKNVHPTVKPIALMRYLCRLITPPGGTILDPYIGSGSTGVGAIMEDFKCIGIEREEDYAKIAEARINHWGQQILVYDPDEVTVEETGLDLL